MKTSQIEKLMSFERNEAGEISKIIINAKNEELGLIPVRANGTAHMVQSAVYAALDYYRHRMYNHPFTQEGLHFYTPDGLENQFSNPRVGAVSVNFKGNENFPLVPTLQRFNYGWAAVGVMNRIYTLSNAQDEEAFARKHNFIDALIQGYGLEIFIPAYLARSKGDQLTPWAEAMLAQWLETNDEKAMRDRNERIARMFDNKFLAQPFVAARKNGEQLTAEDVGGVNGDTIIKIAGGTEAPLSELEMGRYLVYNGNRVVRTLTWDGSIDALAIVGQIVKRNWEVRIK